MKKLNGYRPTHRNKWVFIKYGLLAVQEVALLEFYADIFDFDNRHANYGLLEVEFEDIASVFNCSPSTIRTWHNKLLDLGFISKTRKKHIFKLTCHERYVTPGYWGGKAVEYEKLEKDQSVEIILQSFEMDFQLLKGKLQHTEKSIKAWAVAKAHTDSIAIGSSKVESRLPRDDADYSLVSSKGRFIEVVKPHNNLKTDEEYEEIHRSGRFSSMTVEDMEWIDMNVKENPSVPS